MTLAHPGRERPHRRQVRDVLRRDLIEWAIPPSVVRPAIHQPVARFRIAQPLVGHRRVARVLARGHLARHRQCRGQPDHHSARGDETWHGRRRHQSLHFHSSAAPTRPMKPPAATNAPSTILSGNAASDAEPVLCRPALRRWGRTRSRGKGTGSVAPNAPSPRHHTPCAYRPPNTPRCRRPRGCGFLR